MAVKKRLVKAVSSFAFWFYVEMNHNKIIAGLRDYLAHMQPEDIPRMVRKGEFPPLEGPDFFAVSNYAEQLEKIPLFSPNDDGDPPGLVEYLAEARPDLVKAIQDMGKPGAEYLVNLRLHVLKLVKHPEKPLAESTEYEPKEEMVKATCDQCGKSFPVPKSEADSLDICPFCKQ